MAKCRYCGENAGWFRSVHEACQRACAEAKQRISREVGRALDSAAKPSALAAEVEELARAGRLASGERAVAAADGFVRAVEAAFEDGVLTPEEESRLEALHKALGLRTSDPGAGGALRRVERGAVLRDVLEGRIEDRRQAYGRLPFNFQKTEKLVHVFDDVEYHEWKTRTHYTGGSQGVSLRVARGVYYRVGGFKGERYQTQEAVHADDGALAMTTRHLYFAGAMKRFRVRWDRIVAFDPYADGLGIMRDAQTAKPQTFVTGDGWFAYNLAMNLAQGD